MQVPEKGLCEGILVTVCLAHILLAPYTKVEESFALQAAHDFMNTDSLADYDHQSFPGVVPRTFVGSLMLSLSARPFHWLVKLSGAPLIWEQYWIRAVQGCYVYIAFSRFNAAVAGRYGGDAASFTALVTAVQFHLPFYMTRTLPNTLAMPLVLLALEAWLFGRYTTALGFLAVATVIFRCDILILLAPLTLQILLQRQVSLRDVVWIGSTWGVGALSLTVCVDSILWERLIWPEGAVLLFNTVENRSAEWGVHPAGWYFTNALPRAMTATALLVPLGLLRNPAALFRFSWQPDTYTLRLLLPPLAFIGLYSALPHKELRFIFPALPVFNAAAGRQKTYPTAY
ncbi:unnamed protein product [Chrysoparadoxa australica]